MNQILYEVINYLQRNGVVFEKLTDFKVVTKFSAFYGTLTVKTAFISVRPLSLYWAKSIQSMPLIQLPEDLSWSYPINACGSKWPISLMSPYQNSLCTSTVPPTCYMPP
jgi:hypothetical protein